MYMYYLLGYLLIEAKQCSDASKERIAENTYLLALDGDVDFQPDAALRLVDLMKKNKGVGAACGRIHPTGSGYMPGNVKHVKNIEINIFFQLIRSLSMQLVTGFRRPLNMC